MDLSIIIVTHNSSGVIGECLSSLRDHPPGCESETIIVDNASSDGTTRLINERFEEVRLQVNEDNRGYSRGVNQGIALSSGRLILILNPDIIVGEGSVDRLIDFMKDNPDAGMAGSKLIDKDGKLQYSCRSFYTLRALLLRRTFLGRIFPRAKVLRRHLLIDYDHEEVREVDWILGACMMVRRDVIEKIGAMDERFFLYFEDVDWCYRMKQHGWKVYYVPQSVMVHLYRRASAGSIFNKPLLIHILSLFRYYEKWNRVFYFLKRHRPALKSAVFILSDMAAINGSFFGAYWLRHLLQGFFSKPLYPLGWYSYFIVFFNLIFILSFLFGRMYRIRRETSGGEEFSRIARVVFTGLAILMASTFLSRIRIYSRAVIIGQGVLGVTFVFVFRRLVRYVHRIFVRAGFDHKRIALAGNEEEVAGFNSAVITRPDLGLDIVGHIGEGEDSLGGQENAGPLIEKFKIQEIFVLPSFQDDSKMTELVSASTRKSIPMRIVSPVARFLDRDVRVDEIGGHYILSIERGPVSRMREWLIRLIEILLALVILPLSLAAFLAVRLYSVLGGRVGFFVEKRFYSRKEEIEWPRVVFGSGREGSDLLKPSIYLKIIFGRLGFVGTPPLPAEAPASLKGTYGVSCMPGISGGWRLSGDGSGNPYPAAERGCQDRRSIVNFVILLFSSLKKSLSGEYPEWFYYEESK